MTTRGILILCIFMALLGWFALGSFTYYNPPDALNRLISLAILWPTLLATFLPPAAALFVTLCVWLRMIQALNWANTILMFGLFVMTEALLSGREK